MVIIYYNIFLPLLLTLLSDNRVLLSPFPPSYYLFALPYWLSNGCHVAHAPPLVTICLPYRIEVNLTEAGPTYLNAF